MNDVKDICERVLDGPAPALSRMDSAEVLTLARRAAARRVHAAIVGIAGCAMVLVAVLAATIGAIVPADTEQVAEFRPSPPTGSTHPPVPPQPVPDAGALGPHGPNVAALLAAAVPGGHITSLSRGGDSDEPTILWLSDLRDSGPGYLAFTSIDVKAGDRSGRLSAVVRADHIPAPEGDLCSASIAARVDAFAGVTGDDCEVTTVDGVRIRVTTARYPGHGETKVAIAFLNGGYLAIRSEQSIPATPQSVDGPPVMGQGWRLDNPPTKPPLAAPLFSTRQLARLAANPAMLP